MNESARSIPSKSARRDGARERRQPVRPVDVQPQAALGAHVGERPRGRRRCRSSWCPRCRPPRRRRRGRARPAPWPAAEPSSRPVPSTGTASTSTSMTRAALAIEECASALQATTQRVRALAPRGGPARVWRAATSADRLPSVPPCTKTPPASAGQPDQVGDPAQRLVLGVHRARALEPRAAVDRRGPDDHVEERRRLRGRPRDERQVARVVDRDAGLGQHLVEERPARARRRSPRP